ncbi:YciK family oxidoreductase [Aestuariirhabdus litorea]|uniref:YciK family oxidoreductase n=1 Tax=Aestuariirhabdus litorea TaxID=2528527 RepID=A0A3P3VNN1_9GAMM|nr:YciK family oxidoreductase [Aestuariirhabdus litorea]RRJ84220.1 YciK family oxidoreductase [Aestuariirhabdus litorea]RWW97442.1 YciK family oxidoreductase [Endozoicomonadaceae bacterium GTF-13]
MFDYHAKEDQLKDKVILVTGAGAGIGKAAAIAFARHGATVILVGKTAKKLESVYDEIEAAGYPTPVECPLNLETATEKDYADLAEQVGQEFGHLDGLLHNASELGQLGPLDQYDSAMWNRLLQVNLTSQFLMSKALMPLLAEAPNGSLVFTSSSVGRKGRAYWGGYAISKFATEGMMQVWADEVEGITHIRINSVNPGATRTAMRARAYPAENPNNLPAPDEIMPLYLYLMSDDSVGVNGQALDAQ